MTWVLVAAGLALGVDWRRLTVLFIALAAPLPSAIALGFLWWRARPGLSMRAATFCEAVSSELRAGASVRSAVERAALSVDADQVAVACRSGAEMSEVAAAARAEFVEIGPELGAVLERVDGLGVSPAALFDEVGGLALAQVEVAHEVSVATAPARATGAVLLVLPLLAVGWALTRGGLATYLRQPAQRAAVSIGAGLALVGLIAAALILRRAR